MGDIPESVMDHFIDIIAEIESSGNAYAVGDNGAAYGVLQIQQGCLTDYNRWNKTDWKLKDLLGNEKLSRDIFKDYMRHYATEERLGRVPTFEDMGRIWNGGPNGWKKSSTRGYGVRVSALVKERNLA